MMRAGTCNSPSNERTASMADYIALDAATVAAQIAEPAGGLSRTGGR